MSNQQLKNLMVEKNDKKTPKTRMVAGSHIVNKWQSCHFAATFSVSFWQLMAVNGS
ncbi:hypothetical protein KKB18_08240 [bacterium]|nr:hypothetical protein [bacterium]